MVAQRLEDLKVETVGRIQAKEVASDEIIAELTRTSEAAILDVKSHATELENSIRYRVSDCETLVKSRVTEDYVKQMGERIKQGIMESVSNCLLSTDQLSSIV